MPEEKETTAVEVELVGPHLRVDARPAQLVALLRGSDGGPVVTARPAGGPTRTESVPTGARQVTCRVSDELSVEATRGADFVALAGEGGRRLVVAFTGEVTVLPAGGAGDRFALAAHEAFLLRDHGAEPKVVPVAALSEEEQAEVTSVVEAAAAVVLAPVEAAAAAAEAATDAAATGAPAEAATDAAATGAPAEAATDAAATGAPAEAATDAAATGAPAEARDAAPPTSPAPVAPKAEPAQKTPPAKKPAPAPARAASGAKKGKKGKGRPQPAKKAAPLLVPAAGGAGGAAKAAGSVKKAPAPVKKAAGGGPGKGTPPPPRTGGGGGGAGDESYEESPGDRRVLVVTMVLGLLGALVLSVFLLTGESEDPGETAAPTTTAEEAPTTAAPTATSAPAGASTTQAPTTTAPATTTSAAPAPVARYDIEPKSCVQSGSSITYTGSITNRSTVPFDYTIAVVFKDAGDRTIATANATVSRLAPDRATDFTTTATGSGTPTSCDVSSVEARPSR